MSLSFSMVVSSSSPVQMTFHPFLWMNTIPFVCLSCVFFIHWLAFRQAFCLGYSTQSAVVNWLCAVCDILTQVPLGVFTEMLVLGHLLVVFLVFDVSNGCFHSGCSLRSTKDIQRSFRFHLCPMLMDQLDSQSSFSFLKYAFPWYLRLSSISKNILAIRIFSFETCLQFICPFIYLHKIPLFQCLTFSVLYRFQVAILCQMSSQ